MENKLKRTQWSCFLCIILIITMTLFTTGCNSNNAAEQKESSIAPSSAEQQTENEAENNICGEGNTKFDFTVVDQKGQETQFEIHTDKETVGDALQELGLIEGEEGEYGLFVKTVNGITADYDKDGSYWAFYVNDEYAQEGVDATAVVEGAAYAFKVE